MASDTPTPEEDGAEHLVELVRRLAESGQAFSITLGDTAGLAGKPGGERTRRFLGLVNAGACRKWVYQPGTGLVCVDPPS